MPRLLESPLKPLPPIITASAVKPNISKPIADGSGTATLLTLDPLPGTGTVLPKLDRHRLY